MSVEAMLGAKGSFDPFVSEARPHIGQVRFFVFFTRLIELIFLFGFFVCLVVTNLCNTMYPFTPQILAILRWLNLDSLRASHARSARRIFLCK
jgi:hypothetical protein